MSAIKNLKAACGNKPIISFKNLTVGNYVVTNFRRVETKFGVRIRTETIDSTIFLPERFSVLLSDEDIIQLNAARVIMRYKGRDVENNNRLILDFEEDVIDGAAQAA